MRNMCSHVAWISIHIIGFSLTPSPCSSLASIHNHCVSIHFLFWQTHFSLSVTKHVVDIMRFDLCAGNENKNSPLCSFCWVNTLHSLNQVNRSLITGDLRASDSDVACTFQMELPLAQSGAHSGVHWCRKTDSCSCKLPPR